MNEKYQKHIERTNKLEIIFKDVIKNKKRKVTKEEVLMYLDYLEYEYDVPKDIRDYVENKLQLSKKDIINMIIDFEDEYNLDLVILTRYCNEMVGIK